MKKTMLIGVLALAAVACQPTADSTTSEQTENGDSMAAPAGPDASELTEHKEYHENGALKIEGQMHNGQRQGVWKAYYPDGKKWSETTFDRGIRTGPTRSYYANGMIRYNGQYRNDERSGNWNFYNEEGVLEKTVDFDQPGSSPTEN